MNIIFDEIIMTGNEYPVFPEGRTCEAIRISAADEDGDLESFGPLIEYGDCRDGDKADFEECITWGINQAEAIYKTLGKAIEKAKEIVEQYTNK